MTEHHDNQIPSHTIEEHPICGTHGVRPKQPSAIRFEPSPVDVPLPDQARAEILERAKARHPPDSEIRIDPYGGIWVLPAAVVDARMRVAVNDPTLDALLRTLDNVHHGYWKTGKQNGIAD